MAVDASQVRQQYVFAMQAVCRTAQQFNNSLNNLAAVYNGDGLSGTFVDAELAANSNTKHLLGADIGTITADLNTVQAAMTPAIMQILAKCVGIPLP